MPTKAELVENLNKNTKLLKETIARLDVAKSETDMLQEEFDQYQGDAEEKVINNALAISKEMLELYRMESPEYAIAYVEAALASFPGYPEDDTLDLTRIPPNLALLRDLSAA